LHDGSSGTIVGVHLLADSAGVVTGLAVIKIHLAASSTPLDFSFLKSSVSRNVFNDYFLVLKLKGSIWIGN